MTLLFIIIPILALLTGLVAVLRMPREAFPSRGETARDVRLDALQEEVTLLREELASTRERVEFTERLLLGRSSRGAALGEKPEESEP